MKLENKVAIVTGAASGMGEAIAKLYAREGAKVIIADSNLEGVEKVNTDITNNGGEARAIKVDFSDGRDIDEMINTAVDEYGHFDILVNNVNIIVDGFDSIGEITDQKWDQIFDINTKSVMRAMRKAINHWENSKNEGIIINTIPVGGLNGIRTGVAYGASKHAVVALTKNAAYDYSKRGIRINGISPGVVSSINDSTFNDNDEYNEENVGQTQALSSKSSKPQAVARAAIFLGTEESSFINGTILSVDGSRPEAF